MKKKKKKRVLEVLKILSVSLVNTAIRDYSKHLNQWFLTWVQWIDLTGSAEPVKKHMYVLNLKKIIFYFSLNRGSVPTAR